MSKDRRSRNRKIRVIGKQRKDVDADVMAGLVLALGRRMRKQESFFVWLTEQDSCVVVQEMNRRSVAVLDGQSFLLFDDARLTCKLPEADITAVLQRMGGTPEGARRYWPPGLDKPIPEWVQLPSGLPVAEWERFALRALQYVGGGAARD